MSTAVDRSSSALDDGAAARPAPADGLDLLGEVDGSGYADGAALVLRADGQMVQLGPLLYALLEELDGERDHAQLSAAMCEKLGRACTEEHVAAIAQKLAEQGLLAGSEQHAPERSNPLLALRWKVVVTNPELTRRLTAPFLALFRPWILLPVLLAFVATCWFVVGEKGVASGFAQAFQRPELILLLFVLGVAAAGFHELGHAAACRYGGGTPGAMGAGIYLVWPAFYTDVTDAYRLPTRDRLRTDLGGLYFNAIVAVATLGAWFAWRIDALLLLIGLQLLAMVKQLSPVIRADGYHILSDITGVPDLYAHIVPTLKRLVPGQPREGSALTGRARVVVTLWVLVVVPILLGMALSAVLLLPKVAASAWESGGHVLSTMSADAQAGRPAELLVGVLRLLGLMLPVVGMALIVRHLVAGIGRRAAAWTRGRPARRALAVMLSLVVAALLVWAWWPAGQYEPIRASDRGTIGQVGQLVSSEPASSRTATTSAAPDAAADDARPVAVPPGTHLAISLIPEGGATEASPAVFVITDPTGDGAPIIIASSSAPSPTDTSGDVDTTPETSSDTPTEEPATVSAVAFAFGLPDAPKEGDSQALAVNRTDGSTMYSVAYSLVTVGDGDTVDQRNGAHAYANCNACTTVAVSFQVILVVGSSPMVTPVNIAEALNGNCPACVTTAIANQIVVTVGAEPSDELLAELNTELERLDAIKGLGPDATPRDVATQVAAVQQGVNQVLVDHGVLPSPDAEATGTETQPEDGTEPAATETPEPPPVTNSEDTTTGEPATDPGTGTDTSTSTTEPGTSTTPTSPPAEPAPTTP